MAPNKAFRDALVGSLTRGVKRMVSDMVRAARVCVFFIDESQRVSWNDSGSVSSIQAAAAKFGATFHPPFKLATQFRCNGSTGYLNWLDDVLQIRQTGNFENWGCGAYEFKLFDRAEDRATHGSGRRRGARAGRRSSMSRPTGWPSRGTTTTGTGRRRMTASSRWGAFTRARGSSSTGWGCTGDDLVYRDGAVRGEPAKRARTDKSLHGWKGELRAAKDDPAAREKVLGKVDEIIKGTYRVLLSRGRRGAFVWCKDEGLREYLRARLALAVV